MVGRHDEDRVFIRAVLAQLLHQTGDLVVDQADHPEVVAAQTVQMLVVTRVPQRHHLVQKLVFRAFHGQVLESGPHRRQLLGREHRIVGFADLVRVMRFGEREPHHKGLVVVVSDPLQGVVHHAVGMLHLGSERRRVVAGVHVGRTEVLIEGPGLFVDFSLLGEMVVGTPVVGVLRLEVCVVLAHERRAVAVAAREGEEVVLVDRVLNVVVRFHARGLWEAPREERHAGRTADRGRGVGTIEPDAFGGHAVHEGGDVERIALPAAEVGALLVRHDEDEIGFSGSSRFPGSCGRYGQRQQRRRAQRDFDRIHRIFRFRLFVVADDTKLGGSGQIRYSFLFKFG